MFREVERPRVVMDAQSHAALPIICAIEADRDALDVTPDLPVLRFAAHCLLPASFGALDARLDRMLMHTVATLTLRSLLSRLASALESTAGAAEGTPAPWQRDTGSQAASD